MKKFLIVGLGNIGNEYVNTRHNIGFKILDYFADKNDLRFSQEKYGHLTTHMLKGRKILFLKPNTYMNLSGKAVKFWLDKENIPLENCLIITDDLNLPFGTLRLKGKGSDGGHNGLKSLQFELNTTEYPRFRFGISNEFKKGQQVDFVLGQWNEEEFKLLSERLDISSKCIESFVLSGLSVTMNNFNNQ